MSAHTATGPVNRLANFLRPRKQATATENKNVAQLTRAEKSIQVLSVENEVLKNANEALKKKCGDLQDRLQQVEKRREVEDKDGDLGVDSDEQEVDVAGTGAQGVDKRCTVSKEAQAKSEPSSPLSLNHQPGMSTHDHQLLPPELWLNIIRWATYAPPRLDVPNFEPFLGSLDHDNKGEADAKALKCAVVQVCKLWRDLALSILYEDVKVGRGVQSLVEALGKTYRGEQLGRCVRRLELPYPHTGTITNTSSDLALQILQHCPEIETLVRPFMQGPPDAVRYEFPIRSHSFLNLKRLEWWHYNDATRSGGINSLINVLRHSPNLQYLIVGGEMWTSAQTGNVLELPALKTLRLRRINPIFVHQICQWRLPSLVHIVVDFPLEQNALDTIWQVFGARLCTVEFARHVGFLLSDQITRFLRGCPQVKTFNYFFNFTSPPPIFEQQCALQCISLHAFPCGMVTDMITEAQERIRLHLAFLSRSSFPALRHIILYGDWGELLHDPRFVAFEQTMLSKGCSIEHATGGTHSCNQSLSA
ncbi:uncharacterized protein F5891DRAFT_10586 [Suillus fuscotomentosus]|uniref:F-box domain-containing protein n=1 Tax=Suillus fuscotomentosus TaxID=1912939 RepID=A0AAD4ELN7_9AGAM|nr:uncharacterized protein F5891DRAFT_10586 [Suillus fuscotomentosus]KAG1908356.1 hypothetical protein F5891DRAFT_10586 [Suillus fuscotomentosus]